MSSSRIIIKGLPKKFNESRLRTIFGEHGDITQILYLPKRRIAYVGYSEEKMAEGAVEYRNETYIDTDQIKVSLAFGVGDERIPRPWSQYSKGSSANAALQKKREMVLRQKKGKKAQEEKQQKQEVKEANASKTLATLEKEQDMLKKLYDVEANPQLNPELHEYMQVMVPKNKRLVWANDGGNTGSRSRQGQRAAAGGGGGGDESVPIADRDDGGDGDDAEKQGKVKATLQSVPSKRRGGEGVTYVRQHLQFEDSDDDDTDDEEYQTAPGVAKKDSSDEASSDDDDDDDDDDDAGDKDEKDEDEDMSDSEWLKSKIKSKKKEDNEGGDDDNGSDDGSSGSDSSDGEEGSDNDDAQPSKSKKKNKKKKGSESGKAQLFSDDSDEEDEASEQGDSIIVFTAKLQGLPFRCTEQQVREFFSPLSVVDIRFLLDRRKRGKGVAFVDFATKRDYKAALKKHRQTLGPRFVEVLPSKTRKLPALKPTEGREAKVYPAPLGEDDKGLDETGRIFVRNLAYVCTEDDIRALFEKFGPLSEVHMPLDTQTKKPKGIAFVTFLHPENAVKAFTQLDASVFKGRLLHLLPARTRDSDSGIVNVDTTNYKEKKAAELKSKRENSYNWNTLFLRQDAVADSMAAELGVSKGELLNAKSDSGLAVRLAMGETRIIQDNKQFLRQHGVYLDAFDTRVTGRSKTVILVKNLPFNSTEADLRPMFEKHGAVDKFVFPPSRTMALVSFIEPSEARAAFRGLAYRKYKGEMLYLEWAPENVFAVPEEEEEVQDEATAAAPKISLAAIRGVHGQGEAAVELESTASTTVFVKNLNFETGDNALYNLFQTCGTIRSCRVATKKNPHNPQELLSMGFGFVEFKTHAEAVKAMKKLQGAELDGHKLELKLSTRTQQQQGPVARREGKLIKGATTKVVVRNVAFEATKKDIRQLFTPYGDVKSVRLPPKSFDPTQHRGFAFVEFSSKEEAKSAFEALSGSTHLYGRRLNLEFAKDDNSVEKLRSKARTAKRATADQPSKKAKLHNVDDAKRW
ncbi:hypothetical protein PTSG_03403 [Salpingoeca rosetta]|uniref:RRM domain-containing protein n=1 Tax=Salpingoeca rosetta (strain ATCC 50818 / BSB-021) TaxID=946362 RepID=F2U536_SALR5|nr:uncharacterized protein PTSG_03403 [Salpingoeca rosetta]EGD82752.1 hypothetical protein PTSG_03403 [Salpingoeca rosetta]|eukprot:XP_004995988.1 hypothetical protein PTSG_03403 [Salpingoeca rosetta]